ncbi:flagellar motor protein MotB [Bartonella sp. WD16.2]|uniref:flagellar motor protein MotB n=1 Tax=Bartonella sp. WD16.2 TaxID=1933904 RepID=UPI0009996B7C|nr:flagellar motor protein MotB [Bartonella sp. WD16.2]AQX20279.1 chemotaxis protein MotB [Bartonella sp. WD16.2]
MKSDGGQSHSEIIIVRRGGHDNHDEHHGGVWKIAYADFMTAMMALFLVMWLVNAKDEETKEAIANYFNPIKLMDSQTSDRSIQKKSDVEESKICPVGQTCGGDAKSESVQSIGLEEAELMRDPYSGLEKIVQSQKNVQDLPDKDGKHDAFMGRSKGDSKENLPVTDYRDPFSPHYWKKHAASHESAKRLTSQQETVANNSTLNARAIEWEEGQAQQQLAQENLPSQASRDFAKEVADLIKEITDENHLSASVLPVREGVMIELMDQPEYEMFRVGSSVPTAQTVKFIDRIAKVIAQHPGNVVVSGHTDARPYRSVARDNWQLSTSRAQMAYYMLVRGGLDEKRILRVEGYADRDLKNRQDPYASENRRISIFIQDPNVDRAQKMPALEKTPSKQSGQRQMKSVSQEEKTP